MIRSDRRYSLIAGLMAVASLLISCSENGIVSIPDSSTEEDNAGYADLGEGKFLVTYSLSEGNQSRISTSPRRPIQSLHYYVYDADNNTLIKKRRIRGINKETVWPIDSRNDMTWELRQDLQDTLSDGLKYHILFIANADSPLFEQVEEKGKKVYQHPIIKDDNYKTAQLVLPREAFKEDNMYFMWRGELDRTGASQPKITVKRNDVILERVVTRTDFERKLILSADGAEDEYTAIYHGIEEGLYNQYINGKSATPVQIDQDAVELQVVEFTNMIKNKVVSSEFPNPYKGPNGKAQEFINFLQDQTNKNRIVAAVKDLLIKEYVTDVQRLWQCPLWTQFKTVKVQFEAETQCTHLGFDGTVSHDRKYGDVRVFPIDGNGRFSVVGFGKKDMNNIQSLHFYDGSGAEVLSVSGNTFKNTANQLQNYKYQVFCNPTGKITLDNVNKTGHILAVNLNTVFGNNPETKEQWNAFSSYSAPDSTQDPDYNLPFFEYLYKFVFKADGKDFGDNFDNFKIPFNNTNMLPDLSPSGLDLKYYPIWFIK